MADPQKRTNDLILAAESSLALLAQMEGDVQDNSYENVEMEDYNDVRSDSHEHSESAHQAANKLTTSELLDLVNTPAVEKSVLYGLAHVKVVFPDRTAEYVDVNPQSTTVGETLASAWKKRYHTTKFLDKKKMRGVFQGQEVANDWLLIDCGLALEGILQLHIAQSTTPWKINEQTPFSNLSLSSISSAYNKESERSSQPGTGISSSVGTKSAEWIEKQVRPEEHDFAKVLEDFYQKLDMTSDPNKLCQEALLQYVDILQNHIEKREKSSTLPFQLNSLSNRSASDGSSREELKNERNTWLLLIELRELSIRAQTDSISDDNILIDSQTTEMDVIATLEKLDQSFALQKTLIKWLESIAMEEVSPTHDRRSMHSRTLKQLKHRSLSVSMDPDGTLREGDGHVDDDDAEDEVDLLKNVWLLLRAGQLSEASNLCIQLGQPWRAVTLTGGGIPGSDKENDDASLSRWGNPFRILWKQMCWQFAEAPVNDIELHKTTSLESRAYESVIYAALSGHTNVLLRSHLCGSWEHHCWSMLQAVVNYKEDVSLLKLLKLKAQDTQLLVENSSEYIQLYEKFMEQSKSILRFTSNLESLFEEIAASPSDIVRQQATHPHRQIQSKLAISDIEAIITKILKPFFTSEHESSFSWELHLGSSLPLDALSPQLLRFAAHFVLFMTTTGENFDSTTGYLIQKAYIRHLIKHAQHKLVAFYASRLPEEGRGSIYVQLLTNIRDSNSRYQCLQYVAKYCSPLLLAQITKHSVEQIFQKEDDDTFRINALDLLCFEPSHRGELLRQANRLARQFVVEDKQSSLKPLLHAVPEDSLSIIDKSCRDHHSTSMNDNTSFTWRHYLNSDDQLEQTIREHLCWKSFVEASEAYEEWRECIGKAHHGLSCYEEEESIVKGLLHHSTTAIAALYDVLQFEGGWLHSCSEGPVPCTSVQTRCLPFTVFSLHRVCEDSITWIGGLQYYPLTTRDEIAFLLAQKEMMLASVVANESFKVYQSFSSSQMKHLMKLILQSASRMISLKNSIVV
ncbi:hypothetical protein AeMF1_009328 [Aphanomyces euteiches]|nr:hypothetical protein AeMF1_009328 [Aphanomyces euteiches]KAH9197632.1 hypothetical protein AeNC1_000378 [Aphanomyces euteiches]